MAELETIPEELTETEPDQDNDLARIGKLIAGDSPEPAAEAGEEEETEEAAAPAEQETAPDEPASEDCEDSEEPEVPEIDYNQVVPMPDGQETVTIGQLKDHYRGKADFETERETWESHRMGQDNQMAAAKRDLIELAELVGTVNPDVLANLNQRRNERKAQQKELLLGVYPEWTDPAVKKAASVELIATAKEMGYSEIEFAHIDDYRHIKVLQHLSKYMAREKAGLEQRDKIKAELPKGRKSVQRKQSKSQLRRATIERARTGSEGDKIAAIGALIDGA